MKLRSRSQKLVMAALALSLAAATWAEPGRTLTLNGSVASTRLHQFNGEAYVPLSDIAKALGQTVVKTATGYEIIKAGGANPISGKLQGKTGDVLFDGRWRFQVIDVSRADAYTERFAPDPQPVQPRDAGDTLVVVNCEAKNGLKQKQPLGFFPTYANTALTDDQGNSYSPLDADIRSAPHLRGLVTDDLLPGAKTDFALVFSVPKAARITDLVFTLTNAVGQPKTDVRVSLAPG